MTECKTCSHNKQCDSYNHTLENKICIIHEPIWLEDDAKEITPYTYHDHNYATYICCNTIICWGCAQNFTNPDRTESLYCPTCGTDVFKENLVYIPTVKKVKGWE